MSNAKSGNDYRDGTFIRELADVNNAVKALETKDRAAAVAILAKFDAMNTGQLHRSDFGMVLGLVAEELARLAS